MPGRRATIAGCAIALAFVFASAAGAGAPVFDPIGSKTVNEGQLLQFTVSATDPDSDPLTYSAVLLPSGAAFDTTTHTFTWTPGFDQAGGPYTARFRVSDGTTSVTEDVAITVVNVNRAPTLDPIGSKTVNESQLLQFTVSATDPDSDPLTYSAVLLPSGANFNPTTRTFSWTPIKKQAGTYANVAFSASDGISVDTEDITITVNKCRGKGKACP